MQKKQVSFRLSEELIECLEYLSSQYPRISLTEFVDLGLKHFVECAREAEMKDPNGKLWLDQQMGRYMRGESDEIIHRFYMNFVKKRK